MNVTTSYDHENQVRTHTIEGNVSALDIKEMLLQLLSSGESHIEYNALWDFTNANVEFNKEEFSELIKWIIGLADKPTTGKLAIVFESEFGFAIGRMYQGYTTDLLRSTRVFLDLAQARDWIYNQSHSPDN